VCTSGDPEDLALTDRIATEIVGKLRDSSPEKSKQQYEDNYLWITQAADHKLVHILCHLDV
jgi:urocanate hydratase